MLRKKRDWLTTLGWFMIFSDSIFTNWLICLGLSRLTEVFFPAACLFLQRQAARQSSAIQTLSISIKRTNENLMRMGLSSLHTLTRLAYKAHSHERPGAQTHLHVLQHTRVTNIKCIASDNVKSSASVCFKKIIICMDGKLSHWVSKNIREGFLGGLVYKFVSN